MKQPLLVEQPILRRSVLAISLATVMLLAACHKKTAPPPPPPPPPPSTPTASLTANPETIDKGQSTSLTWQTSNATDVSIDGIGAVQTNGSQQVTPSDSTTYTLTAKGPGGSQQATARVTVSAPAAQSTPTTTQSGTEEEMFSQNIKDIYFGYDKSDIGSDQQSSIQADVDFLKQHPGIHFTVEGHCDERGSTEYNIALSDSRANAVKGALVSAGVSGDGIKTVPYGKEKPFCTESNEQCWQQNRRGHFVYQH